MNDTDKQRLTEWLGEFYCSPDNCNNKCSRYIGTAVICNNPIINRAFTTPQDVFDLKDRLVEKGLWREFLRFAFSVESKEPIEEQMADDANTYYYNDDFIDWLFRTVDESGKPHFARLVSEFLK